MKKKNISEAGAVVVEATILLPIAILCVILLLYVSIFVYQKAILQAALETSVVYFKNTLTDHFVIQNEKLEQSYTAGEDGAKGTIEAIGNRYEKPDKPLNPYAKFSTYNKKVSQEGFASYFQSIAGKMLYDDKIKLTIDYSNYVLFKEIEVTAEQIVKFPIDFSIIGVNGSVNLSATARVAAVDHDELIRNMDYAVDILEDTKVGEVAKKIAGKIGEVYSKMRSTLKGTS